MRAVLWLVALFGIAVAVALFAGNNPALVSFFWPPHRVDISLNLLLLLLAGFFALLYGALRALSALFALPGDARAWRAQQKERALYDALVDSLAHWLAGRYIRAARAADQALLQEKSLALGAVRASQVRTLAHLLAAESAQSLQNKALRESHLQRALHSSALSQQKHSVQESVQFRAARWALEDRDPGAALDWLAQLPQGAARRTLALRLKLQAAQQARQPQQALETARLLAKHGAFSPAVAHSVVRGLVLECLGNADDTAQLHHVWLSLDAAERLNPDTAVFASGKLMQLAREQAGSDAAAAANQARNWLLPVWDQWVITAGSLSTLENQQSLYSRFIEVLETGMESIDPPWLARIEAAQQRQPQDAALCYLAGLACLHRQLWGKARQLLEQAAPGLQGQPELQRKAWRILGELADERGDAAAAAQAFRLAARV